MASLLLDCPPTRAAVPSLPQTAAVLFALESERGTVACAPLHLQPGKALRPFRALTDYWMVTVALVVVDTVMLPLGVEAVAVAVAVLVTEGGGGVGGTTLVPDIRVITLL